MKRRKTIWVLFVCMIIAACGQSACAGTPDAGETMQEQSMPEPTSDN